MADGPMIFIQSYDGMTAQITTEDGSALNPVSLSIEMRAGEACVVHMEFIMPGISLKAKVGLVEFNCPLCDTSIQHNCKSRPMGNDRELPELPF